MTLLVTVVTGRVIFCRILKEPPRICQQEVDYEFTRLYRTYENVD